MLLEGANIASDSFLVHQQNVAESYAHLLLLQSSYSFVLSRPCNTNFRRILPHVHVQFVFCLYFPLSDSCRRVERHTLALLAKLSILPSCYYSFPAEYDRRNANITLLLPLVKSSTWQHIPGGTTSDVNQGCPDAEILKFILNRTLLSGVPHCSCS